MDEFDFIRNIKNTHSLRLVGDDCAVLPKDDETDLLVTADMLVEDVDFRLDWSDPHSLGHRALAVSLSDIAAMGGKPTWALLSLGIPERLWNSEFLDAFYEGWHKLARRFDVELAGGDISRIDGPLVIDSTVGGVVPKGRAILRSGASPGDAIYVTGPLGSSAAGLKLLETGRGDDPNYAKLIRKHLRPEPRLYLAGMLQASGIPTAMIDVSDGLSSDLAHVCHASGTGARIDLGSIPFEPEIADLADSPLDLELNGGEDFELLFTADPKKNFGANFDGIFRIGEITGDAGIIELLSENGTEVLKPRGYRHF